MMVLFVIGVWCVVVDGVLILGVLVIVLVFFGWYGGGLFFSECIVDCWLVVGWLLGFMFIWFGVVIVLFEFVWFVFLLWLFVGFVL